MEPISISEFKSLIADEKCDIVSDEFWNPIVKVLDVNLFVNVNDKYVIVYNNECEIHINCMVGIYKDNDGYVIERENVFDKSITETYRVIKHSHRIQ